MVLPKLSAVVFLAALSMPGAAAGEGPDLPAVEKYVIERTNELRREQGLGAASGNARLGRAARHFAQYMASTDRYGHAADGAQPGDRAARHGYEWCLVSENISYQYTSGDFRTTELADRYVEGWKRSPGHRKNMLEPHVVDTAVAVVRSEKTGRYYAVQMFGRPKSQGVEFRITNAARDTVSYQVAGKTFSLAPGAARIHQQCGPEELSLRSGRAVGGSKTARPKNGDRLVVVREAGGFALRGE